ncbi:MAG: methyl-accepting chemotaxis protein [Alteromonadaceae bacterium]|nr:methyl-accepting chemotaxis protein [Alteromonadaceae bacterium]
MNHLNIRQKVVLTTLVAVVLAIVIMSVFALKSSRSIILEGTLGRELPAVLGEVANNLDAQLLLPITVSQAMASNSDYIKFIADGEPDDKLDQVTQYLAKIKQEFNTITAFIVSEKTGKYYTPNGLFKTLSSASEKDQWFYRFMRSGKTYELSLDVDEATKIPTLFINYIMKVNGTESAVAGVGLSLDSMAKSISQYRIGKQGKVFLVDTKGVVKLHPNVNLIGKNIRAITDVKSNALLNKSKFASVEYQKNGVDMLLASRYLDNIGWYIVAQVPSDEVFGALDDLTWSLVVIGIVIAGIFMVISAWLINRLISPFGTLAEMLETIGQGGGDLTLRLDESKHDETGKMAHGYNQFVSHLSGILQQVSSTGQDLFNSVDKIDQQSNNMEREITAQVSNIEQVATAMHEMGATAEEIAGSAHHAAENAQGAGDTVQNGNSTVQKTIDSVAAMGKQLNATSSNITELADDINAIDSVLEVIRGISEQTNLLALNAAIEAARAGEQGRGFAVVADEVRTLASRSHESTEQIRNIIENIQSKASAVVIAIEESIKLSGDSENAANQSGEILQSISDNITIMNDMNLQIATATGEQSKVVAEINPHITAIADVSKISSDTVKQTSVDCSDLRNMTSKLNELVSKFKFK